MPCGFGGGSSPRWTSGTARNAASASATGKWIGEAARRGEVLLCKDSAIARGPAVARGVYFNDARVFALAHAGAIDPGMADLFLAAERAIVRMACRVTGPYVVSVSRACVRRLRLAYPPSDPGDRDGLGRACPGFDPSQHQSTPPTGGCSPTLSPSPASLALTGMGRYGTAWCRGFVGATFYVDHATVKGYP
ncbi:MAG: hypothetical protein M3Q75_10965 [Gemmatimonadota bacterium]|nr:hypothetical protein [Gemmatimonadota bacterium]